jgi:hypothetical protein
MHHRHKAQVGRPDDIFQPDLIGDAGAEMTYHAIVALDETASSMERKWGMDRLPKLVSVETATKFGSAKAKLDDAIRQQDDELIQKKASVLQKGWLAMDREAFNHGAATLADLEDDAIHHRHPENGRAYVIVRAHGKGEAVEGARTYTLDEVCRVLDKFNLASGGAVEEAKRLFPGAEVSGRGARLPDDEIPF